MTKGLFFYFKHFISILLVLTASSCGMNSRLKSKTSDRFMMIRSFQINNIDGDSVSTVQELDTTYIYESAEYAIYLTEVLHFVSRLNYSANGEFIGQQVMGSSKYYSINIINYKDSFGICIDSLRPQKKTFFKIDSFFQHKLNLNAGSLVNISHYKKIIQKNGSAFEESVYVSDQHERSNYFDTVILKTEKISSRTLVFFKTEKSKRHTVVGLKLIKNEYKDTNQNLIEPRTELSWKIEKIDSLPNEKEVLRMAQANRFSKN